MSQSRSAAIHESNYRFLQQHVYSNAGIVLEEDKHYLFESRLNPIVRQHNLDSINDLCSLLIATRGGDLSRQVVEAMTTNETYFFRDTPHFDAIRATLLPRLKTDRRATRTLRFWSAAASTGQEAYTLAMVLLEEGLADWNLQIIGTDLNSKVLERARQGRYSEIETNRGMPASLLTKYFHRSGSDWQLHERVRRMVQFEVTDLRQSMRHRGPYDLVLCRNVLIYFDNTTKMRILEQIHGTLSRGGWLLLGGAETALGTEAWFTTISIGATTIYVAR